SARGLGTKTTQARVSMVCSMKADSWPPHDGAQIPLGGSQIYDLVCSMRAKSRMTAQLDIKVRPKNRGHAPRGLLAKPVGLPVPLGQMQPGTRCTPRGSLAGYRITTN